MALFMRLRKRDRSPQLQLGKWENILLWLYEAISWSIHNRKILTANNISFEKEKTFPDCVFPDTKQLARFDFYVNNEYIIEFDGEQHFSYVGRGWNTKEQFKKTVLHDKIKNQWCSANGIKIIRIPYTHEQNICLEDLLLETSVFIKEV